jgi:hypothetical protein
VGDRDPALGQDQLDIPQAEAEDVMEPYGVADDLGGEAVSGVGGGWPAPLNLDPVLVRELAS